MPGRGSPIDGNVWVGGAGLTCIHGTVQLWTRTTQPSRWGARPR